MLTLSSGLPVLLSSLVRRTCGKVGFGSHTVVRSNETIKSTVRPPNGLRTVFSLGLDVTVKFFLTDLRTTLRDGRISW